LEQNWKEGDNIDGLFFT